MKVPSAVIALATSFASVASGVSLAPMGHQVLKAPETFLTLLAPMQLDLAVAPSDVPLQKLYRSKGMLAFFAFQTRPDLAVRVLSNILRTGAASASRLVDKLPVTVQLVLLSEPLPTILTSETLVHALGVPVELLLREEGLVAAICSAPEWLWSLLMTQCMPIKVILPHENLTAAGKPAGAGPLQVVHLPMLVVPAAVGEGFAAIWAFLWVLCTSTLWQLSGRWQPGGWWRRYVLLWVRQLL